MLSNPSRLILKKTSFGPGERSGLIGKEAAPPLGKAREATPKSVQKTTGTQLSPSTNEPNQDEHRQQYTDSSLEIPNLPFYCLSRFPPASLNPEP